MNRNDDLLNQVLKTEQAGCRKDDTQCCGKCEKSMSREQLAKDNGMTIEFVNWFFENKKDGCGNVWFMMMAAMWEGYQAAVASMQSERDQLAADSVAIKAMNDCLSEELRGYESDGAFDGPKMHLLWWKTQTPATDRFLAEQRAVGVEMFAEKCSQKSKQAISSDTRDSWWLCGEHASDFAAQLRNEVNHG